jgi:putative component of membrane protein insertase Oxa1/YidC/SpoIIIJ protein YidD
LDLYAILACLPWSIKGIDSKQKKFTRSPKTKEQKQKKKHKNTPQLFIFAKRW